MYVIIFIVVEFYWRRQTVCLLLFLNFYAILCLHVYIAFALRYGKPNGRELGRASKHYLIVSEINRGVD